MGFPNTDVAIASAGGFLLQAASWVVFGLCLGFGLVFGEHLAHKLV